MKWKEPPEINGFCDVSDNTQNGTLYTRKIHSVKVFSVQ